jgi:carboxylesterase
MRESSKQTVPAAFSYPGHGPNARIGVAICHGFTGSPLSVMPWALHLAEQGFAVSVPLLPGHGTHWRELARSGWREWAGAFENAYLELAGRTDACYVAGLSMGGAVALRTAPIVEANPTAATTEDGDYSQTPLSAVHQLKKLFAAARRGLPRVTAPVLVFKSDTDEVVPPSSLELIRRRLGSAELRVVPLPNSGHVATLDNDAPAIFGHSTTFFHEHAPHHVSSETS